MSVFKRLIPGKSGKQKGASSSSPQGATPQMSSGLNPQGPRSGSRSVGQSSGSTVPDSLETVYVHSNRHLQLYTASQDPQGPRHSVSHERPSRNSSRNSTTESGRHSVSSERPNSTRVLWPNQQDPPRMPPLPPNPATPHPNSGSSGPSGSASRTDSVHLCPPRDLFFPTVIPKIPQLDPNNVAIYDEDPFTTPEEAYTYEPFSQPLLSVRVKGQLTFENGKFMFF